MPKLTRLAAGVCLLTAALLLAACAGSTTSAGSTKRSASPGESTSTAPALAGTSRTTAAADGAVDPCALLTQSEVDAATSQPLGVGARAGALEDCQWSSADFAASVELDVGDWSAIKAKEAETGQTLTAVTGVGDEAATLNRAGNAAELYVRHGKTGFLLLLGGGQYIDTLPDLGLAQEKVLAAAVLGRL